jgi:UDP-N-acetylmuramyl pentapeptide phosphotransferase/UDP-N-acetylglucosamine-1-phosphate transferase
VTIAILSTLLAATLAVVILRRRSAALPVAVPGARSLHDAPVVRVGGLAILAGIIAGLPAWSVPPGITPSLAWAVALATFAVAAISALDDWRGVRPATRLAVQALAAAGAAWAMPVSAVIALPMVLAIVWMANLFNFMDGSDGLAASAAIAGFTAYAAGAFAAGSDPVPFVLIAVACAPFLAVNLPPARMFMGDVGAVTLGFMAAVLGAAGIVGGIWPAWLPLLAFAAPILDATLTLARRAWRRERVYEAHKAHYYQRFHQMGAGHGGTLALYASLSAATSATAAACALAAPRLGWAALGAWMIVIAALFAAIDYHWRRRSPTP